MKRRNLAPLLTSFGLIGVLLAAIFGGPAQNASATQTFPQTNQSVWGPFEAYWNAHGGLAQFGLPRTAVFPAGDKYDAQYFERALFTYTPSNPDPFKVQLQLLGAQAVEERMSETPFKPAKSVAGATFVPETQHNLAGKFLDYWKATGGLEVYGYPISEPFSEKNAADGKSYMVQYFQRNRFELHPENANTPFEVELGLLGSEALDAAGGPDAIAKLGRAKFYPQLVIEVPGVVVTPDDGATPEPTRAPMPAAPALPPTTSQVSYQNDFAAASSISAWKPVAALGPQGDPAASWSVNNGSLFQSGVSTDESAADETVLLSDQSASNFTMDVEYYGSSGEPLGVVFRYGDNGFYLLQLYGAVPNNAPKAVLTRYIPGAAQKVGDSGTGWAGYQFGTWQRLTVTAAGSNFTIAVDGQQIIKGSDSKFASGAIGLYAWADGSAHFDNLRITTP